MQWITVHSNGCASGIMLAHELGLPKAMKMTQVWILTLHALVANIITFLQT